MPIPITLPRLGWSMDKGTFIRWLKKPGEVVRVGEPLFELEGEKAIQEIEAVDAGVLFLPASAPPPGSILPVGAVLGILLQEGEDSLAADRSNTANSVEESSLLGKELVRPAGSNSALTPTSNASPSLDNGPTSRVRIRATPRARRLANELHVAWEQIQGTGRGGRIRERDVRVAHERQQMAPAGQSSDQLSPRIEGKTSNAASLLRSNIARRMKTSLEQTAPVTLTTRADATNLVGLRDQFRNRGPNTLVPSYTDIVAKIVAIALRRHPRLNARWDQEQIMESADVHIGIAVDTEHGLLVPVLRDVLTLSLRELTHRSQELISRARERKLALSELQGGTFTITNLGQYGIDTFTPIINYPETAILGVGAIRRVPIMLDDDRIVARNQVTLNLTFDHRTVDGAPAARFLQAVVQAIESPAAWLLDG